MELLKKLFFIFIYFVGNTCPVFGQEVSAVEGCYYNLGNVDISRDGRWITYMKIYNDSTLWFLKSVQSVKPEKKFKEVSACGFIGTAGFVAKSNSKVEVHNLGKNEVTVYDHARLITNTNEWDKGAFIYQRNKVLTHYTAQLEKTQWKDVEQFQYNQDENILIIRAENQLHLYTNSINGWKLKKREPASIPWLKLRFTDKGYWYVYLKKDEYYLRVIENHIEKDYPVKTGEGNYRLVERTEDLEWDGERLWFKLNDKANGNLATGESVAADRAEVWKGTDQLLYPVKQRLQGAVLACYIPEQEKLKIFKDSVHSGYVLANGGQTVMMYNDLSYQKYIQHDDLLKASFWDASSEELILKIDSLSPYRKNMVLTQNMNKLVLFKDKGWWVYEINNRKWVNLSKFMKGYYLRDLPDTERIAPYYPILSHDQKFLYVHDSHDVWQINMHTYKTVRLTRGKEGNTIYRIADGSYSRLLIRPSWEWSTQYRLNKDRPLVFKMEATDKKKQGFAYLKKEQLETIIYTDAKVGVAKTAGNYISFVKETFDTVPELWLYDLKKSSLLKIFESNYECEKIPWGKAEMIDYEVEGFTYSAALFYPKDYTEDIKYPMVVNFYEDEAERKHEFVPPNYQYGDGFNKTDYSLNGYFVLTPDIHYEFGNPGGSAVKHLEQSVLKAVNMASIDKESVGLLGHSFGGYQVNYTIGHSNLFKAAVSSAGISNLVSWYFHISANTFRPEFWRMEGNQLRMGKSYFEIKETYEKQSPIRSADNVNTPLLLVAGKNDQHVIYTQTIEMFLALYRLQKPVTMLLYPDEAHGLLNNENNIDLRNKVMQWFDYHLKQEDKSDWMSEDY